MRRRFATRFPAKVKSSLSESQLLDDDGEPDALVSGTEYGCAEEPMEVVRDILPSTGVEAEERPVELLRRGSVFKVRSMMFDGPPCCTMIFPMLAMWNLSITIHSVVSNIVKRSTIACIPLLLFRPFATPSALHFRLPLAHAAHAVSRSRLAQTVSANSMHPAHIALPTVKR